MSVRINWRARREDLIVWVSAVVIVGALMGLALVVKYAVVDGNLACRIACVVVLVAVIVWLAWMWLTQDDFEDRA
jgi:hypothetical protein